MIMKREDFKQIIKFRSCWKVDKRKGNYKLPNNERLSDYIERLVRSQMEIDHLAITSLGHLCVCDIPICMADDYIIYIPYGFNENCSFDEMERRIKRLVYEIVG